MKSLLKELCENCPSTVDHDEALSFVEDILRCLENEESEECETNQGLLGVQNAFRGHIAKV